MQVGRGARVAAAAAAGGAGTAGGSVVGVRVVPCASELALDVSVTALALGSILLEGVAVGLNVISGGGSEGTDDVVQGRELNSIRRCG